MDTVLAIYQGGAALNTLKTLTNKTPQELREFLERLSKDLEQPTATPVQEEQQRQPPVEVVVEEEEEVQEKKQEEIQPTNEIEETTTTTNTPSRSQFSEYPLQFDTRNQNIPLEQIFEDETFLSNDFTETATHPPSRSPFSSLIHSLLSAL